MFVALQIARRRAQLTWVGGVRLSRDVRIDLLTEIESNVVVGAHSDIASSRLGRGTYLSEYVSLRHTSVGRFCSIADSVRTGSGTHPSRTFVSTHPAFFSPLGQAGFSFVKEPRFGELPLATGSRYVVEIGNDVWIGSGVRILDGIRIGDGAIVGAGAVVTRDVEPFGVYVGVPARRVRMRFSPEQVAFLCDFRWWDRELGWLARNACFFADIEMFVAEFAN